MAQAAPPVEPLAPPASRAQETQPFKPNIPPKNIFKSGPLNSFIADEFHSRNKCKKNRNNQKASAPGSGSG